MTYMYQENTIEYSLVYKRRKSLGIYLDVYGNIEIRVPKDTQEETIIRLIESKWNWIITKQIEMKQRSQGVIPKAYEDGETFLYLGKNYPIQILYDPELTQSVVKFHQDTLHITVPLTQFNSSEEKKSILQQSMKRFYYKECKRLVEKKIKEIQPQITVKPSKISISDDKSKWGSCDSRRQLTFNWKLAMAPERAILYLVIHEMCHLEHLNHDRSFWRLVGKLMPDYEEQQNWLLHSAWKMSV